MVLKMVKTTALAMSTGWVRLSCIEVTFSVRAALLNPGSAGMSSDPAAAKLNVEQMRRSLRDILGLSCSVCCEFNKTEGFSKRSFQGNIL